MASQQDGPGPSVGRDEATAIRPAGSATGTTAQVVGPPPESKENVWLRRSAIASFWAVVFLLGLPMWLKTTAVYRAALPLQRMSEWANGQVCYLLSG